MKLATVMDQKQIQEENEARIFVRCSFFSSAINEDAVEVSQLLAARQHENDIALDEEFLTESTCLFMKDFFTTYHDLHVARKRLSAEYPRSAPKDHPTIKAAIERREVKWTQMLASKVESVREASELLSHIVRNIVPSWSCLSLNPLKSFRHVIKY